MEDNNTYNNFIFRDKWWTALQGLDHETLGKVISVICAYAFDGTEPDLTVGTAEWMACTFIMADVKNDKERYDNVVEKRREAGKRGGAPVGNSNASKNNQNKQTVVSNNQNKQNKLYDDVDDDVYVDEEDTTSTPKPSPSAAVEEKKQEQQEREEVVFDYALQLLEEGRANAYTESSQAYDHNEALGWKREITRPNGTTEKQEIQNKRAWLRKRQPKNEQMIPPEYGILLATVLRQMGCSEKNKTVVDDFRGVWIQDKDGEDEVVFLYTKRKTCMLLQSRYEENKQNNKFASILNDEVRKRFPKAGHVSFGVPSR